MGIRQTKNPTALLGRWGLKSLEMDGTQCATLAYWHRRIFLNAIGESAHSNVRQSHPRTKSTLTASAPAISPEIVRSGRVPTVNITSGARLPHANPVQSSLVLIADLFDCLKRLIRSRSANWSGLSWPPLAR